MGNNNNNNQIMHGIILLAWKPIQTLILIPVLSMAISNLKLIETKMWFRVYIN